MRVQGRLVARRLRSDVRHALGEWRWRLRGAARGPDRTLLILGCQRSGTTLMTRILDRDPGAKVYPEHSSLSCGDRLHRLRLAPLPEVASRLAESRHPLVVLKPLVESQRAPELLDALPDSRGLWMFRHYADVAQSNLARFGLGNGLRNLRSVARGAVGDWRAEGASAEVREQVLRHFSESMNPWDAAVLFWWVRNHLFFDLALQAREDLRTCRYEELVADPQRVLRSLYAWLGRGFPGPATLREVNSTSVGRGSQIELSPAIRELCDELLGRLEKAHGGDAPCA